MQSSGALVPLMIIVISLDDVPVVIVARLKASQKVGLKCDSVF